jgi:alkylation response protein AidB-like acyl-CoA dehydrogenase
MAIMADPTTWLDRAKEMVPLVEEYAPLAESERHMPYDVFTAARDAGIFGLLKARALGGAELDLTSMLDVLEELSRQHGSLGWNVMIGNLSCLLADYLPEATASAIYGRDEDVLAGSFAPTGKAIPVEGGYRITGRWSFASGCDHATWMVCSAIVTGEIDGAAEGPPDVRLFFMPRSSCEIADTWFTTGMRGTGSKDFIASDVFVPHDYQFPFGLLQAGPPNRYGIGHPQPFFAMASPLMAGVALGIASRAVEEFKDLAIKKVPRAGSTTLANQHTVHEKVGLAEAHLRSARSYLHETVRNVMNTAEDDPEAMTETVALARLAGAFAAQSATHAVDLMFDAGGGTSIYVTSPLERCFRDVHMVTHHIAVAPSNIEMSGQYLLGLGLQVRR